MVLQLDIRSESDFTLADPDIWSTYPFYYNGILLFFRSQPPQMVGIMMPMPLMNMMEPMTPMMDDKFPSAAMMAMMMASMDKKPEMNEPVMEMKTPASMMSMPDMMKMMKGADARPVNGQMMMPSQLPSEPSDQQVLAAVHALEHRRLRAIPRNIHIH